MTIDSGDVSNSQGIAVGDRASASNAVVNIHGHDDPGPRQMIKMLWLKSLTDDLERQDRQKINDGHFDSLANEMKALNASMIYWRSISMVLFVIALLAFIAIVRILGWV